MDWTHLAQDIFKLQTLQTFPYLCSSYAPVCPAVVEICTTRNCVYK